MFLGSKAELGFKKYAPSEVQTYFHFSYKMFQTGPCGLIVSHKDKGDEKEKRKVSVGGVCVCVYHGSCKLTGSDKWSLCHSVWNLPTRFSMARNGSSRQRRAHIKSNLLIKRYFFKNHIQLQSTWPLISCFMAHNQNINFKHNSQILKRSSSWDALHLCV